eukprot:686673-Rhodomonas_salina.2
MLLEIFLLQSPRLHDTFAVDNTENRGRLITLKAVTLVFVSASGSAVTLDRQYIASALQA